MVFVLVRGLQRVVGGVVSGLGEEVAEGSRRCGEWFLVPRQLTPRQLTPRQLTPRQLTPRQLTPRQLTPHVITLGSIVAKPRAKYDN